MKLSDLFYDTAARAIWSERVKLSPLDVPEDIQTFNALRSVSAQLCVLFESDPDFDHERFIGIAMRGVIER